MTLYRVDYTYMEPSLSSMELEMDDGMSYDEYEAIAIAEIKEQYPDIDAVEIEEVVAI